MIYVNEPFLAVHWEEDANIVWAEWKSTTGGAPMQRGLNSGLDLVIEKKSRKWLADTRNLGTMAPADVKWVSDDWVPRAVAGGVRWMAFVAPKKVIMQIAVTSFMARINDQELGNAYFDDVGEARAWLRAQA